MAQVHTAGGLSPPAGRTALAKIGNDTPPEDGLAEPDRIGYPQDFRQ